MIDEHRAKGGDGGKADFEECLQHDFGAGLIGIPELCSNVAAGAAVQEFVRTDVSMGAVDGLPAEIYGRLRPMLCRALHHSSEIG